MQIENTTFRLGTHLTGDQPEIAFTKLITFDRSYMLYFDKDGNYMGWGLLFDDVKFKGNENLARDAAKLRLEV